MNVCNVLGGRSTSTSQNLHWIYPKVFNSNVNLLKLGIQLFDDSPVMTMQ